MKITNNSASITIEEAMDALHEKDRFLWNQVVDAFHEIALDAFQQQNGEERYFESGILYEGNSICFQETL
jgi:hypothetical protein